MASSETNEHPGKPEEKKARRAASAVEHQAERLARGLGESAQNVWLAGLGALGRAQSEGSKLFSALVEEGARLDRQARKAAGDRATETMETVNSGVDEVRGKAGDTWDRLESAFDERMQRALARLGVPSRQDVQSLERQVEALRTELRRERAANATRETAHKAAAVHQSASEDPPGAAGDGEPPRPAASPDS
ncbi:MAG: phasin family protein [Gammaproteobacteria bacterium]|nr:phasin family protein [Gammaproteobacteria bacterium]